MTIHEVPHGVQPVGLARYLSRAWPSLPGAVIRETLRRKDIRVNGVRSGADAQVVGGDQLVLYIDDRFLGGDVRILYEDEQLLAVEKPAGLPVDVDAGDIGADTLITRLRARNPSAQLCHRLDAGTGGALLCALTGDAHAALLKAFAAHEIHKRYQAIVLGCPEPSEAHEKAFLVKDAQSARVRVMDQKTSGALSIETRYRVLQPRLQAQGALALVEIELLTGRTHQIRAHMAHLGHPLLGDDKYGDRAANKAFHIKSPQLWCAQLSIEAEGTLERYRGTTFCSEPHFLLV